MKTLIYEYKNCSTCVKALKFLDAKKIVYEKRPIVDTPPSLAELKRMLSFVKIRGGSFKNLFNTSGVQYRELGISDQIKAGLGEVDALKLLAANGKLIKRPFLLTEKDGRVGFKEDEWTELFR